MEDIILTPGYDEEPVQLVEEEDEHLQISNYLSEYNTAGKKAVIRENIGVYSKDDVYTKNEIDTHLAEEVADAISKHLGLKDPHKIIPLVKALMYNLIKNDGTTPFIAPQVGVDPISKEHLTTKRYVDNLMYQHLSNDDSHQIAEQVAKAVKNHPYFKHAYTNDQLYTKQEINNLVKTSIKNLSSKPLDGIDPVFDNQYATKSYVDKLLYLHLIDEDLHKVINTEEFLKQDDVYSKKDTYTKKEVNLIISKLVDDVITPIIAEYLKTVDTKLKDYDRDHKKFVKKEDLPESVSTDDVCNILELNIKLVLNEINGIEQGVGFDTLGTYQANPDTYYLSNTKSIMEALTVLDNEIHKLQYGV